MNYNEENSELFDRFLNKELSGEELADFERRLLEDKQFAETFHIHSIIVSGIRDHGKQELKAYLKEHGKVESGDDKFRSRNIFYAAAAVFVLFAGVYTIIHFYIQPNGSKAVAINQEKNETVSLDSTPNPSKPADLAQSVPPGAKKDELVLQNERFKEAYNAPPAEMTLSDAATAESMNEKETGVGTDNKNLGYESEKDEDIHIAVEKKLKDTTMVLPVLYAVVEESQLVKAEVMSAKGVTVKTVETNRGKKSKKMIPSTVNNNAGSGYYDDKGIISKDTAASVSKPKEKSSTDMEDLSKKSMHVEFWQSPVNFRGYKYVGNTIYLYGVPMNASRLFIVNNAVYLRTGGFVYLLTQCLDGCEFKAETNTTISDFIIKQE